MLQPKKRKENANHFGELTSVGHHFCLFIITSGSEFGRERGKMMEAYYAVVTAGVRITSNEANKAKIKRPVLNRLIVPVHNLL